MLIRLTGLGVQSPPMRRDQSLDVLRGVAILMVLIAHACSGRLAAIGSHGVDLFFVLSGFLISGLLFAEMRSTGDVDLARFWLRRGLKIWPSYYVSYGLMLALLCLGDARHGRAIAPRLRDALPNLIFLQNYWHYDVRWLASWSLAVEEHFYLALPLVLLVVRKRPRLIPVVCAAAIVACPILRIIERVEHPARAATTLSIQTHFRIDALCMGVLLRYIYVHRQRALAFAMNYPAAIIACSVAALAIPFAYPWGQGVTETIGLSLLAAGFTGLVAVAAVHPDFGSAPGWRWIARAGVYSYTIYLAEAIAWATPASHGVSFVVVSIVAGVVISHVVERPILRKRAQWAPAVSAPPATLRLRRVQQ